MKYFDTFGVMVDCSRNAVMTVDSLKRYIDILSKMGYSTLQLYTEDTYEVEGEPYFGYFRGRFTVEELQTLDAYAMEKGIELIPCIQTLAHLNSIVRWQPYHKTIDCDDILLIGADSTYELIDHMFASLRKSFHGHKVHLGMDEAYMVGLGRYREINGVRDRFTIMAEHLGRVREIAGKYGFECMLWNDMFYHTSRSSQLAPEQIKNMIPRDVSLVYWDYYRTDEQVYITKIRENRAICDRVVFAGGAWTWHGFAPLNRFSINATKAALSACIKEGVRDAFITCWGDDGAECSMFSVLPTLAWAASLAENENATIDDVRALFYKATGENYDDFMMLDMPNMVGTEQTNWNNPCKYLLYNDPFMGTFDYTVDESYSTHYAHAAKALREKMEESKAFSYLFETQMRLCELLAIKCDLGVRTRYAYKNNDKDMLLKLAKEDYPTCIELLKSFALAFEAQWFSDNKPHGFDVQDLRIGALLYRLQHCARRLEAYAKGEVADIPELAEEVLLPEGAIPGRSITYNVWSRISTCNVVSHNCR